MCYNMFRTLLALTHEWLAADSIPVVQFYTPGKVPCVHYFFLFNFKFGAYFYSPKVDFRDEKKK